MFPLLVLKILNVTEINTLYNFIITRYHLSYNFSLDQRSKSRRWLSDTREPVQRKEETQSHRGRNLFHQLDIRLLHWKSTGVLRNPYTNWERGWPFYLYTTMYVFYLELKSPRCLGTWSVIFENPLEINY